ncbi:peroxisomal membrane protein-domain-containing protein [Lipomyces oligophaga]|uniref:peroxisomal membrane protein-domain-containing protein n=1 Tax=Lipomyces oligophaga TaxID=45792 RepID=UPI0034CF74E8
MVKSDLEIPPSPPSENTSINSRDPAALSKVTPMPLSTPLESQTNAESRTLKQGSFTTIGHGPSNKFVLSPPPSDDSKDNDTSDEPKKTNSGGWLGAYESFLLHNAGQISSVESTLQHLCFLFPGKFKDAEVVSEVVYATLGILGMYHDTILIRSAMSDKVSEYKPTLHTRYTRHYISQSSLYRRLAYILACIQKVELLCEILARRKGGRSAQQATVLGIESTKAMLRLLLLRTTKYRTVPIQTVPERDVDPDSIGKFSSSVSPTANGELDWVMPRTGRKMPQISLVNSSATETDIGEFLTRRVLQPEDVAPGPSLMHILSTDGRMKETLYILRPLIYAMLSFGTNRVLESHQHKLNISARSKQFIEWLPWIVGFALEWSCRDGFSDGLDYSSSGERERPTGLEKEELKSRNESVWRWAVRGTFYERFTKPLIDGLVRRTDKVPLLNLVGLYVADYQYLMETYHFATSTM